MNMHERLRTAERLAYARLLNEGTHEAMNAHYFALRALENYERDLIKTAGASAITDEGVLSFDLDTEE